MNLEKFKQEISQMGLVDISELSRKIAYNENCETDIWAQYFGVSTEEIKTVVFQEFMARWMRGEITQY